MILAILALTLALFLTVLPARDPQPETVLDPITVPQGEIVEP